jgi:diadenosine tetraphosphate (Ap4A) HIT family hydrolase
VNDKAIQNVKHMKTLTIKIADEYAEPLERLAQDRAMSLDEFLGAAIDRDVVALLQQLARHWMPRAHWDELVRGEECRICHDLMSNQPASDEGFVICDLGVSRLRLRPNQFVPGYCVLTCFEHVREPYELDEAKRRMFFDDLMFAGRAIEQVLKPDKMNFEILGNAMPHLHCHIKPRFYGDSFPGIPINENARTVLLNPQEYADRVTAIRAAILIAKRMG